MNLNAAHSEIILVTIQTYIKHSILLNIINIISTQMTTFKTMWSHWRGNLVNLTGFWCSLVLMQHNRPKISGGHYGCRHHKGSANQIGCFLCEPLRVKVCFFFSPSETGNMKAFCSWKVSKVKEPAFMTTRIRPPLVLQSNICLDVSFYDQSGGSNRLLLLL